jgi:hypothetical protein
MRYEVTQAFMSFLVSQEPSVKTVAILGGSSRDPEVRVLESLFPDAKTYFFDIDNPTSDANFIYLDINDTFSIPEFNSFFDLVVSSQVLEHIWNHANYFSLVTDMTHRGSLVWLNCPKSNLEHGSPHYYAAGFTASYLANNLSKQGFQVLHSGEAGNKRYYLAVHFARYWQTPQENSNPLLRYNFQPGTKLGILRKFLLELPSRLLLTVIPQGKSKESEWATESYVGARKER